MSRLAALALAACACSLSGTPADAHEGRLDANGCHYDHGNLGYHCHKDVPPNPDASAVAKKSRDNICHDSHSPNYLTVKYFISYRSMKDCVASGGRKAGM
jgi:hypothetical protein